MTNQTKKGIKQKISLILCFILVITSTLSITSCNSKNKDKFYGSTTDSNNSSTNSTSDSSVIDISKEYSLDIPDYSDYFELGDYKNIEYYIDDSVYKISDDMVDIAIAKELGLEKTEVKNKPAQNGDTLTVSFDGKINNKSFEGGTVKSYKLVLGTNTLSPTFEKNFKGMKNGESKDIEYTFPKDYSDENIAGKKANFKISVEKIERYDLSKLTDEYIKNNTQYGNLKTYRNAKKTEIQSQYSEQKEMDSASIILNKIIKNSKVKKYDQDEINKLIESAETTTKNAAKKNDQDVDTYVKEQYGFDSYDSYKDNLSTTAKNYLENKMLVYSIAKAENLGITEKEYKDQLDKLAEKNNIDTKDLGKYYSSEDLILSMQLKKVQEWLLKNSKKSDNPL